MNLEKLPSLPARLRRPFADPAGQTRDPQHGRSPREGCAADVACPSSKLCRESITDGPTAPTYRLLPPGQAAVPSPPDIVGWHVAQARTAQVDNPASARALQPTRRLSLSAASGRADAEPLEAICARPADVH